MKKLFSVNHYSGNIDLALLIARIGIAVLMLTHGIPKIEKLGDDPVKFIDFLGLGTTASLGLVVFAEVFCSILILVGFGTRFAVIPLAITMLVAVLHVHGADPFSNKEMGIHYLLVYVVLFITGSGRHSIDGFLCKKIKGADQYTSAAGF